MGIKIYAEIIGIVAIVERYIENGVKECSTKDILNILGKYYGFGISVFSLADLSLNSMKYVFCNDTNRLQHVKIL